MSTTLTFKDFIDLPEWRPLSISPYPVAAGTPVAFDLRNNADANPFVWQWVQWNIMAKYHKANDEWLAVGSGLTFTLAQVGTGSLMEFVPSHGPAGLVGGSPTTTSFTLATLPNSATVGINQFANSGAGVGYKIRVYGNGSGGAGKCEERLIVGNTAGTAPVVTLDSPLSFTPQTTDHYEMLSGRIYLLGSASVAAGSWKAYDVATETVSGNLTTTNLPASIGSSSADSIAVILDELYVPYNRNPGEGMVAGGATYNGALLNAIQGTAAASTTITGSAMPAGLLTNEFTNFQVRIVEDVTTPTAVGQRRRIASHTSGATGVFTIGTSWSVTPSSSAKFVIEQNNDFLLWASGQTNTYSYAAGGYAADASWSGSVTGSAWQYAGPSSQGSESAGAMVESCFAIVPDAGKNARNSDIIWFKGNNTMLVAKFDIANGANGTWTTLTYGGVSIAGFTAGSCSVVDPVTNQGRYMYICYNGSQRNMRFDLLNRVMEPWCYLRYSQGTVYQGAHMATYAYVDGSTKVGFLWQLSLNGGLAFNCLLSR